MFVANFTLVAQAPILWDSLCCGAPDRRVDRILGDDSKNSIYAIGDFIKLGPINSWGIAKYANNKWDSVKGGIGNSLYGTTPNSCQNGDLIWYKNKLYIGDADTWHNKQQVGCLGVWDGINWAPLPYNPFLNNNPVFNFRRPINSFKVIDDELYIGGSFDSVGSQKIGCITKFDGSNFYSLNYPSPHALGNIIYSIEKYKNELYVGGNLLDSADAHIEKNLYRIFRYNGSKWYSVGNGIKGGASKVNSMVIYKGYLYVAGVFRKAEGNAGNYIMKWDGNNWFSIPNGIEGTDGEVLKLLVHNDKLYVFGAFNNAGDIPASKMAVYDGKQWCDLGGVTYGYVKTATFFKDTLYVGGSFGYIGNRYIWYVAKRLAGDYHDTCGVVINTDTLNQNSENASINIIPNPFTENITIQISNTFIISTTTIYITNSLGQNIFTSSG